MMVVGEITLGSKQIGRVTQTKPDLDMDQDGQPDATEIGQHPGTADTWHELLFINTDIVGSPIVATEFKQQYANQPWHSQQGAKRWTQNYFPYGERREEWSANNGKDHTQWFGGKTLDTDTGLSYFGARYYDAAIGRFMAVDPVGANPASIHLQNRYAYANNNPYKFGDPDGRLPVFLAPLAWNVGRFIVTEAVAMAVEAYAPVDIPLSKKGLLQKAVRGGIKDLPGGVVKGVAKGRLRIDGGDFSQSEVNAAWHMASQGKNVRLRQPVGTRAEGGTSDLLVDGMRYDVYTPTTGNASRVISAMAKKNSQTEGIVLDLSKTNVTTGQLGNVLGRVNGTGATNISDIVIMGK